MNTNPLGADTHSVSPGSPTSRVWLVAALAHTCEPTDRPAVRDDLMRTWVPEPGSGYRTRDGRRRATWAQLHSRFDLVEVTP
ncbi:hypothetical protein [Rhodococcus opacus]|uniref:hypothetical protein n=1 Tax=Rhodococcus opacus TaxID=37919 RepID=UPI000EA93E74|nr:MULTISPECIES: hypothetical protein [Rhodococcus]QZS56653.1 hypothetical protein FXW36_05880 [Rhodococcus opacus]RKM76724.1 hypothetical protein COO55_35325 [Rhodococcus opacus]GLK35469.1 hypothetical protein GCM10017611_23220 [Rhodococcus wratislaviensis]